METRDDGLLALHLFSMSQDLYFSVIYSIESYRWKISDIISSDEYYEYSNFLEAALPEID